MGKWLVDGVDISTYATNVTQRASTWTTPGKRGSNQEIPGRDGAVFRRHKPASQGVVELDMWAAGCNPDGTMPTDVTRAMQCRVNYERVAALLTKSDPVELVRVESAGYLSVNRFANPGAETAVAGGRAGYHNWVTNPEQVSQVLREVAENLVTDPSLQVRTGPSAYAENLFPDPFGKRYRATTSETLASNYWGSTSYEDNHNFPAGAISTTWWLPSADTDVDVVSGWSSPRGTQALRVFATADLPTDSFFGRRGPMAFPNGATPNFRCKIRRKQTGTASRSVRVRAAWYDSGGTHVSSSGWSSLFALPTGTTWVDFAVPGTVFGACPYAAMSIQFQTGEAWASGDGFLLDAVQVSPDNTIAGEAAPFFDGDDSWGAWSNPSNPGRTVAYVNGHTIPTWQLGTRNAFNAYALSTDGDVAGTAVGFVAQRAVATGTQQFTMTCAAGTVGVPYTLRFRGRALTGSTCTVELCTTTDGGATLVSRGSTSVVGSGGGSKWETGSGMAGTVSSYEGPTHVLASGQTFVVRVTVPVRTVGDQVLQVTALAVTDYREVKSGDSADTAAEGATFTWAGTAYQSKTTINRLQSSRFTGRHAVTSSGRAEIMCRVDAETTKLQLGDVTVQPEMVTAGFVWKFTANASNWFMDNIAEIQAPVRAAVQALDGSNGVLATYTGSTANLAVPTTYGAAGADSVLSVASATLPAGTAKLRLTAELLTPKRSQLFTIRNLLLLDRYLPSATFFDGNNGGVWTGAPNASTSQLTVRTPAGYNVTNGTSQASPAGVNAVTVVGSGTTRIAVDVPISTQPAGQFRVGIEVSATVNCNVYAEAYNGSTYLGFGYIGQVLGASPIPPLQDRLQGVVSTSTQVTSIRFYAVPHTSVTSPTVRFGRAYVFTIAESHLPRIRGSYLTNPGYAQTTRGWAPSPGATASIVKVGTVSALATSGNYLHNSGGPFVSAGDQVWTWARVSTTRTCTLEVRWYNSSNVNFATDTITTSPPTNQTRTMSGFASAPAGVSYGQLRVVFQGAAATSRLVASYMTVVTPNHDYSANVDPSEWAWFSGGSGSDVYGVATQWDGTAHASTSSTLPLVAKGWQQGGGHIVLAEPTYRPPGSVGNVIAFPGFATAVAPITNTGLGSLLRGLDANSAFTGAPVLPSQTLVARTTPMPRTAAYLSGEVALARMSAASYVTVRIVACDDVFGSNPVVQWSQLMQTNSEIVSWRDLGVVSDWFYLEIEYVETAPAPGFAVVADNVAFVDSDGVLGAEYPGYFDGRSPSAKWLGTPDDSASITYAGARRMHVEFAEPIKATSMAGGQLAEFTAVGVVPGAFAEDMVESTFTGTTADQLATFTLDQFAESTARNTSCIITVQLLDGTGPTQFQLTDVTSGSWLRVLQTLTTDDVVTIDCANFQVTLQRGSTTTEVLALERGGASPLLPIGPAHLAAAPQLQWSSGTFTGTVQVTVSGRRKYLIQ